VLPFVLLATSTEHSVALKLYRRGDEFSIRVDKHGELMNSRQHHSEDALAELACERITSVQSPHLLVGGLGMGFTLARALALTGPDARITVSELIPAVVQWNRDDLGAVASYPLLDQRVEVLEQDVGLVMRQRQNTFDAIMLDVDNGPDSFTRDDNDSLYGLRGLNSAYAALKPGGVLTLWSAFKDPAFTRRMLKAGFKVSEQTIRSVSAKRGARHNIWIGIRPV